MKKTLLLLAAATLSLAANARILRVNNNVGSSAPHSTIAAAVEAANEGDTIMVDASGTYYDAAEINKRVVVLGPGYFLKENGITEEGGNCAAIDINASSGLNINAEGVIFKGMHVHGDLKINASKVVVNKCLVNGSILLGGGLENCIIHQNLVRDGVRGDQYNKSSFIQVTNNIIILGNINDFVSSYIAYNTIKRGNIFNLYTCRGCTIEHNWSVEDLKSDETAAANNTFSDNYVSDDYAQLFHDYYYNGGITDGDFAAQEVDATLRSTYGAFAGDTPYVLSGVPAGPVIQDLIVPASVEKGNKLQVTVKVGVQQ